MKIIILSILLLFSINPIIDGDSTFKVQDHYKIEATFSANIGKKSSVHLVFAKNKKTKKFDILTYVYNKGKITKGNKLGFDKLPSILNYNFNKNSNILTMLVSNKENKKEILKIVDLNLKNNEYTASKSYLKEDYKASVNENNLMYLLFSNKEETSVLKVKDSKDHEKTTFDLSSQKDLVKTLIDHQIDGVRQNEYVPNGSISDHQLYVFNNTLYYVNKEDKKINISKLPVSGKNKENITNANYDFKTLEKTKKVNTFVKNGMLFLLNLNKEQALVDIYDLDINKKVKQLDLSKITPNKTEKDFTSIQDFLKLASKRLKEPTFTVNKSIDNKMVLRSDFVTYGEYSYNNWWFHHWFHHQMMMQQHMNHVRTSMPSFGPFNDDLEQSYSYSKTKKHAFYIVVDADFETISGDVPKLEYASLNKKELIEEVIENKSFKHVSSCFINNTFRTLTYSKKTKEFSITDTKVDDSI